jgi:hypothetical protein
MNTDFADLEALAQRSTVISSEATWTAQVMPQYQNAPLAEVFDLLESAVESYTIVMPSLAPHLQESARQEIEFFFSVLQDRLHRLLHQPDCKEIEEFSRVHCVALLTF